MSMDHQLDNKMVYNAIIDMTLILPQMKHMKIDLGAFSKATVVYQVEADNPDDACYLCYKGFCDCVLSQSSSTETKNLLKELKNDFIVAGLLK